MGGRKLCRDEIQFVDMLSNLGIMLSKTVSKWCRYDISKTNTTRTHNTRRTETTNCNTTNNMHAAMALTIKGGNAASNAGWMRQCR